jgi:hypothetical protein
MILDQLRLAGHRAHRHGRTASGHGHSSAGHATGWVFGDGNPVGLTGDANQARDVAIPFDAFIPTFSDTTDPLPLVVRTRIGTNPDETRCAGDALDFAQAGRAVTRVVSGAADARAA